MQVINVANGSNQYPGDFTPEEKRIIMYNSKGNILNLFSGSSTIGNVRVDFSHSNATHKTDVFKFLKENQDYYNTIIIDAPYNQRFAEKYREISQISWEQFIIFADVKKTTKLWNYIKKIEPEIIILKSWNYYCLKGYYIAKAFLCYPGGYRKSTILLIMRKYEPIKKWIKK